MTEQINRKYKLGARESCGLCRIIALRDIPEIGVQAGDVGGYVEGEHNLSQTGNAWIRDDAIVCDSAVVRDDGMVRDYAVVCDTSVVRDCAVVCNDAIVYGNAVIRNHEIVRDYTIYEPPTQKDIIELYYI